MAKYQNPRGMHDILPSQTPHWQYVEGVMRRWLHSCGYAEIRFPIVEHTELFKRSIGEVTDIVEKEMFTFDDRGGDSLTLRPEGTAGSVRAGVQHDLLYNKIQRLWYMGPMFRYERPQEGRYRQFHQVGIEAFGMAGPDIDAELILMSAQLWDVLGVTGVALQINSLGTADARARYRDALVDYLTAHEGQLDDDSRRRLQRNPLRVLDSKNTALRPILDGAPALADFIDDESRAHFARLCALLDQAGIRYQINPRLVRGLDYYGKTVFEWVTEDLGAQGTVCAGGRYDGLVEQLGGRSTPAIGMAIGVERLLLLLEKQQRLPAASGADCYVMAMGDAPQAAALSLAQSLRAQLHGRAIVLDCGGGGFKGKFKRADASGARYALVLGDEELAADAVTVKDLRGDGQQQRVTRAQLAAWLARALSA